MPHNKPRSPKKARQAAPENAHQSRPRSDEQEEPAEELFHRRRSVPEEEDEEAKAEVAPEPLKPNDILRQQGLL